MSEQDKKPYGYTTEQRQAEEEPIPVMQKRLIQRNHEIYVIPRSVMPWAGEALYLLVARWCQQQAGWINRNDIARAFHLPVRRATFQLSYISRKKSRVKCQVRYQREAGEGKRQCAELLVEQVLPPPDRQSAPRRNSASGKISGPVSSRVGSGMTGNGNLWDTLLRQAREGKHNDE